MSEIEHTRTSFSLALGKVHHYSNTKILLLAGVINRSSKNNNWVAGDILLRIEYFMNCESMTYYCREK
jgi:hypothetical protein